MSKLKHERAQLLRDNHLSPIPLWIVRGLLTGLLELLPQKLTSKQADELLHALLIAACDTIIDDNTVATRLPYLSSDNSQIIRECYRILYEFQLRRVPSLLLEDMKRPPTHTALIVRVQAEMLASIVKRFPSKSRNDAHAVQWIRDHWSQIASILGLEKLQTSAFACSIRCPRRTILPTSSVLQSLGACKSPHTFRNAVLAYHHKTGPAEIKQLLVNRALKRKVQQSVKAFDSFLHELPRA